MVQYVKAFGCIQKDRQEMNGNAKGVSPSMLLHNFSLLLAFLMIALLLCMR